MTVPDTVDARELIGELPAFALLPDEVRTLVAESFELVSFPFGAVIVREGDEADAFYVLAAGTARVVKQGDNGEEVPLNVLRRGDSFGEIALLAETTRVATVRASGAVQTLRLGKSVFTALTRSHPQVREAFQAIATGRSLWNFFRVHSGFSQLSNDALALLVSELERVDVRAGEIVVREGDPPGPMYVIEEGRVRVYKTEDDAESHLAFLRTGDFFGELSLFRDEPRAASAQAVSDCTLLRFPIDLFRRLVDEHPDFRLRLEQRIQQYDYRRIANVPLDFAEEILPADASLQHVSPEQVELEPELEDELPADTGGAAKQRPIRRFPHVYQLDEMDCGAACLAMICRHFGRAVGISHIRQAVHTSTDGTTLAGITRGAEELGLAARSVRASKSRLEDLPLPAVAHWEGNHWVVVYRVDDKHVRVSDPARGLRKIPREEFLERWSGYTSIVGYTERLADAPEARTSLAWVKPFLRPHLRLGLVAVGLAIVAAALELVLPILTQVVVDRVLPRGDLGLLWILMAAIAAVLVAITGATIVQRYLLAKVAVRFDVATLDFLTGRLLALPMSYFSTRRTGDIERRLLGARQVRAFFVQSGVEALTSVTQLLAALALMFVYSWKLALGLPRDRAAVRGPDALLGEATAADVRQPRGGVRQVLVGADRRDPRDRDREGARRGGGATPADARPLPGPRRPRLPHRVPGARIPGLAAAGGLRLVRAVPPRRLDRGRPRQPVPRRVRGLQRPRRSRDRSDADAALALGPGPARTGAVRPARRRARSRSRSRAPIAAGCAPYPRSKVASSCTASGSATAARRRPRSSKT